MEYKFSKFPEDGTVTISEGYITLVIINQTAEIDPDDKDLIIVAEKWGGQPAVNKKSTKKATESKQKDS